MITSMSTIDVRPNSGLREKIGMISLMMPKAGRMRMYTSGWPKNQNRCSQMMGSPPRAGLYQPVW